MAYRPKVYMFDGEPQTRKQIRERYKPPLSVDAIARALESGICTPAGLMQWEQKAARAYRKGVLAGAAKSRRMLTEWAVSAAEKKDQPCGFRCAKAKG